MTEVHKLADRFVNKFVEWTWRTNERIIYYPLGFPFEKQITERIRSVSKVNHIETPFLLDPHGHTINSDGSHTVGYDAFWSIERRGISIGITDHDTVGHFPYCKNAQMKFGNKYNRLVIPGVELTATAKLENDMVGISHLVVLYPSYEPTKELLKSIERTKEVKRNFISDILSNGKKNAFPIEEAVENLRDQAVIEIPHAWSRDGARGRLPYLLDKNPDACVEIWNPRSKLTFPKGIPDYVIKHGHMVGASDSHFKTTRGDALTVFEKNDTIGSNGKPSLEKVLELMRRGETIPYLVPLNSYARNTDMFRFLHLPRDIMMGIEYFDDAYHKLPRSMAKILNGKESDIVEDEFLKELEEK